MGSWTHWGRGSACGWSLEYGDLVRLSVMRRQEDGRTWYEARMNGDRHMGDFDCPEEAMRYAEDRGAEMIKRAHAALGSR